MMLSRLVWEAAGCPSVEGGRPMPAGRCSICGDSCSHGRPVDEVVSDLYSDWDRSHGRGDPWICAACCHVMQDQYPNGKPGKGDRKGNFLRLRTFSHLVVGTCHETLRANGRPRMLEVLLTPPAGPWGLAITLAGKKHLVPYTPVNRSAAAWAVNLETRLIRSTPTQFADIVSVLRTLLSMGLGIGAIKSGRYLPAALRGLDLDAFRSADDRVRTYRGSAVLDLAAYLVKAEGDQPGRDE